MSELVRLTHSDYGRVKKYIYNNFWECVELAKIFDKNGLKNKLSDKNSGDYYGFINDDGDLKGVFLFTNNKRFLLNFVDSNVTRKLDLLKAIKHYKPEYMSGASENVALIWKMFERTVNRYKYKDSIYMVLEDERTFLNEYFDEDCINVRRANVGDAKARVNFLLEVEREFKRNHLTINQLQTRIKDRFEVGEYLFVEKEGKIVSQAFVEDKINAFSQVGGVYTSIKHRGKSYGYQVVKVLCKNILDSGNIPMLAVIKDNSAAINVYEKLHFRTKVNFSIIEIEF